MIALLLGCWDCPPHHAHAAVHLPLPPPFRPPPSPPLPPPSLLQIVEEGIAQRESDLNIVWLYGYGFPRKHGGPMHWARHIRPGGLAKVVADLQAYAEAHPAVPHWTPCNLLVQEAAKGK